MNRPKYFAMSFIFLMLVTYVLTALDIYVITNALSTATTMAEERMTASDMIDIYWSVLTFKINGGLPAFMSLLIFWPLTLFNAGIILSYILDLIPG